MHTKSFYISGSALVLCISAGITSASGDSTRLTLAGKLSEADHVMIAHCLKACSREGNKSDNYEACQDLGNGVSMKFGRTPLHDTIMLDTTIRGTEDEFLNPSKAALREEDRTALRSVIFSAIASPKTVWQHEEAHLNERTTCSYDSSAGAIQCRTFLLKSEFRRAYDEVVKEPVNH